MMNPRCRVGHVLILCLVLSFLCGASVRAAQPDREIDRFAKAYRAAQTEFERRAVCIEAIDAGVIAVGSPVAVVDAIFGTSYVKKRRPRLHELETGTVDFHPLPPPPRDDIQAGHVGWYFGFSFDSAGKLANYSLSNVPPK
jgi:hypothetical protein